MTIMPREETHIDSPEEEALFTVADLLLLPIMKSARLLAGERSAQSRPIARVHASESIEAFARAKADDLLVVAGSEFRKKADAFKRIIPELAKRGIAGLVIYDFPAESRGGLLPEMLAEAEKYGVPLIRFSGELRVSELSSVVTERTVLRENAMLAELNGRLKKLTALLLEGRGLYAILDEMETMLGNPVAVVRERDNAWLSQSLRDKETAEIWPLLQSLTYRQIDRGASDGYVPLPNASCRVYVKSIPEQKTKQSYLAALEHRRKLRTLDKLSIDRLSLLVGLELANVEAVREVEDEYLDRFLHDWLTGKIVSDADWRLRADVCGCLIPDGTALVAALIGLPASGGSPDRLREACRLLRSERGRAGEGLLVAQVGEDLAAVLPISPEKLAGDERDSALTAALTELSEQLREHLGEPGLKLYAGRAVQRPSGLQSSWTQAKYARQVAEVCGLPGEIVAYDKLGVYSLLYLIPSGEEREQFLNRYSLPLQLADRKGGGRLTETLEMFFRCNGNIKLTSEKLFAHYNTVVYRLERIQTILGVSFDDPEDRLQLHLALKLGQITPGSAQD
ncbi:PucR family transcriptional regulator [Cohnella cellulosilytica]|uniref:PucR family transcriptional regulator n=1 Tax=Cohnella cellulosilytica TaxID=986710 RepID=A0ABW2F632_9BACL